jgi:hypothetical protein
MTDKLYFSRDTKVFLEPIDPSNGSAQGRIYEVPVLEGYQFSQATNTSEVTLNEMSTTGGETRRGRRMFNDSYAPAEWSFQTYIRPFLSGGADSNTNGSVYAVEEALWGAMIGDGDYVAANASTGAVTAIDNPSVPTTDTDLTEQTVSGISTSTDGDGRNAQLDVTVNDSGVISVALNASNKGSGYTDDDKLFISAEDLADALGESLSDIDSDLEVQVNGITASSVSKFTGFNTRDASELEFDFQDSNKAALGTFNLYFVIGSANAEATKQVYKITGCVVNEAAIDFDIEGLATINWSGFGELISENENSTITATNTEGTTATSNFIRNRLTSLALSNGSTNYGLVLTGGNITISNNITFITPETMGVVNQPVGHVTGTRNIGGNFTCYLNGKDDGSAELFETIAEATDSIINSHNAVFSIGGSNAPLLKVTMPTTHLEIPTHSIEDIISLDVNFHALPSTIDGKNECSLQYKGKAL